MYKGWEGKEGKGKREVVSLRCVISRKNRSLVPPNKLFAEREALDLAPFALSCLFAC